MDHTLYQRLKPVIRRIQLRRAFVVVAIVWLVAALIAGLLVLLNQQGSFDPARVWWWLIGATGVATCVGFAAALFRSIKVTQLSESIEEHFPDLDASLMTVIQQQRESGKPLGFLQQDVLRTAINHSYSNRWRTVVPGWHLVAAVIAGLIGLFGFAGAATNLAWFPRVIEQDKIVNFADAVVDNSNYEISIEPGNASVERGSSLLVLARFGESIPPEASLIVTDAEGTEIVQPMSKSLDDPIFGARILAINQPVSYRVDYASQNTDLFDVSIFDFPKMTRADATLKYPAYIERKDKTIQDARRINAVEGTKAQFSIFLNKPVENAILVPVDDNVGLIVPRVDPQDPKRLLVDIEMLRSQKFELKLVDADARENRTPPKFVLNVAVNKPPSLKLLSPTRDIQASALEEVLLSGNAWDDFGIKQFGVSYGVAGKDEFDEVLAKDIAAKKREKQEHLLELEALKAKPDDLVSYYFWAEDLGPDGELRRTASDMFFAEVRHFDEIFRQGQAQSRQQQQQQQQQQNQNAQKAQEMAELQKQIINATWKLVRREKTNEPSFEFAGDAQLLAEAQSTVIGQLVEMSKELEDAESQNHVEAARGFMNEALSLLKQASENEDVKAMKPALSKEKAAYQGLLKLRAREHEVSMQQQQPSQSQQQSQNNRQQQQLDQLNLKSDENRYESERTAQPESKQQQEEREDRQVLNRLRELAQRQADLNERVKELQSAIEEAETPEEREEIERRLKSLREQQEQNLRDTEELSDRMNEEANQERMSEESEKLEDTRDRQQKALEALEKGEVSRAAAEGTRAERDLEELRDEFQDRTAGQFTERMREMKQEASQLEEQENEIAKELAGEKSNGDSEKKPDLREDEGEEPRLDEKLAKQQQAVEELRERMKETIEEAEVFEPLLAEELYDTYRDSEVTRPDTALESARQSLLRGWVDDARNEERRASKGIAQIKEGIEKAAESILGDETDALRAAEKTLRDLNRDLQQEIGQNDPASQGKGNEADSKQNGFDKASGRSENQDDREAKDGEDPTGGRDSENQRQEQKDSEDEKRSESSQSKSNGNQPGEEESEEGKPGDGQPKSENGTPQDGKQQGGKPQEGQQGRGNGNQKSKEQSEQQSGQQEGQSGNQQDRQRLDDQMRNFTPNESEDRAGGNMNRTLDGPGNQRMMQPLTGEDFRDWSDRLRDVEEMVDDPDLRAEAARIREQAREIRKELKQSEKERHSAKPNWDLIKLKVAKPLAELQDRVAEELMRRTSKDALIPLDRDPVPVQYQDAVRRYYERLGKGGE